MSEFRAGNCASAAAGFARVESASPGQTTALLFLAKCSIQTQDFAAAEASLHRYLAVQPNSSDALYLLGFVLNRQNQPSASLAAYNKAAALAAPTGDDLKIVGLDYVLLDDYAHAIQWLEQAVAREARNQDAWYYLGRAYYTKGRLGDARKAFQTVLTISPQDARSENNLGLILETEGNIAAAEAAYRKAIAWQENSLTPSEQPYVNLGSLLMEQERAKDATAPLEKAVALAPKNAYCRLTLGMAYRTIGRLKDAEAELEKAVQIEPEDAKAHYQLGRLYKEMNAPDRAQQEFKKAADLQAKSAAAPRNATTAEPAH